MSRSMTRFALLCLSALLAALPSASASGEEASGLSVPFHAENPEAGAELLESLTQQALNSRWDTSQAARVENLRFERDTGALLLSEGWVFLKPPVGGLLTEAMFFGTGRFTLTAPIQMERDQLIRYLGTEAVDLPVKRADLGFSSLEHQKLFRDLSFSAEEAAKARAAHEDCEKWASGEAKDQQRDESTDQAARRQSNAIAHAVRLYDILLDPHQPASVASELYLDLPKDRDQTRSYLDRLSWVVNATALEEVSLAGRFNHGKDTPWSRIASFALSDQYKGRFEYAATSPFLETKSMDEIIATKNSLVIDIDPGGQTDTVMRAVVDLESLKDQLVAFPMTLTPYLETTAVRMDGKPIRFLHPELPGAPGLHAWNVHVFLPKPLAKGDKIQLEFDIKGKLLERIDGFTFLIRDMDRWYPKPDSESNAPAYFDTTLRVPSDFTAVANGEKIDCGAELEVEGKACFRYRTWKPIFLSFFNLGKQMHVDRGIAPNSEKTPIEVWTNPNSTFGYGISPSKQAPNILAKVQVALNIYDDWFGPFPYAKFAVTPHPRGVGRGGASMLLLAEQAFLTNTDTGNTWRPWGMDAFVSHETAHQWWGNIVGIRGDRDQWFSEGFSDYAATLHLEQVDRISGSDWRIREISEWHEKLTKDDGYMNDLVPLCLGNRYQSYENRKGYEWRRQDFMYNKGGFVMNMLRTHARFVTGSKEQGDELFKKAIRNFIEEQYLKFPSNLDMQKSLSRSFGTDLAWFFKQWVYGMGIPKLEFSYELVAHPEGGTLLRGRVKQRQAGEPFKFPVAVYVRQGKGKSAEEAHFYQMIEARDASFEVGPLPWLPTEVTLNDDLGVLAIVEWRKGVRNLFPEGKGS